MGTVKEWISGKVKTKDDKVVFENIDKEIEEAEKSLPTPDTNPVDGDELIKATKPKKVKSNSTTMEDDLNKLGDWISNLDQKVQDMEKLLHRLAKRMGL